MENEKIAAEKLILTYFLSPPLVDFGENCERGKIFCQELIVENLNDFVSNVRIVKFPEKEKIFGFEPNEILTILPFENARYKFFWNPETVGNIRETVRFRINETFSLHAYLIGRAVLPNEEIFVAPQVIVNRKPFVPVQLSTSTVNVRKIDRYEEKFTSFETFTESFSCQNDKRQTFSIKKTDENQLPQTNKQFPDDDDRDLVDFEISSETFIISKSTEKITKNLFFSTKRKNYASSQNVNRTETSRNLQKIRSVTKSSSTDASIGRQFLANDEDTLRLWLNAVLTPEIFETDVILSTNRKVDVKNLLASIDKQSSAVPPSKEAVTSKIYSQTRLMNDLRRRAFILYRSLQKTLNYVESAVQSGKIIVRKDKAIHADVGLKQFLLSLMFSVNPLWLRLGLETIYGEIIPLKNNNDRFGLTKFIAVRFFNDPNLLARFGISSVRNYFKEGYGDAVGKFFLVKCLNLFIFLDVAKSNRLIVHDPCLFLLNSDYKTIKDVLCALTKEILSGEGNLFKQLNACGYVPNYVQTWLDEMHMPVGNLAADLRDGVRLSRAYEILSGEYHLSASLRGPPISRLQKIHNVELALKNLSNLDAALFEDFDPKKIVGGHREETLELVWKMRMHVEEKNQAATKIQGWFRRTAVRRQYLLIKKSTIKIQRWFRSVKSRRTAPNNVDFIEYLPGSNIFEFTDVGRRTPLSAVIFIQAWIRGALARRKFLRLKLATVRIQRWYRGLKEASRRHHIFIHQMFTIISIQRRARVLLETRRIRAETEHCRIHSEIFSQQLAALKVQRWYRNLMETKKYRNRFLSQKRSIVFIQRQFRQMLEKEKIRREIEFRELAAIKIQAYFRRILIRKHFLLVKRSATTIQRWYRNWTETKKCRNRFLSHKRCVIVIQRNCRRMLEKDKIRREIESRELATIKIQTVFRHILMKKRGQRSLAVIKIQRWYRNSREMSIIRRQYLEEHSSRRSASIKIQTWFRRISARNRYLMEKRSAMLIQRWYRNLIEMKKCRRRFLSQKRCIVVIQRNCRRIMEKEKIRREIEISKLAAIKIQSFFRRILIRNNFLRMKRSTKIIQRWYRNWIETKKIREEFLKRKRLIVVFQIRCRRFIEESRHAAQSVDFADNQNRAFFEQVLFGQNAYAVGRQSDQKFSLDCDTINAAVVKIQTLFRRNLIRKQFLLKKTSAIIIQRWYRRLKIVSFEKYNKSKRTSALWTDEDSADVRVIVEKSLEDVAATKIQAVWRSYRVRKFPMYDQIVVIRRRLTLLTKEVAQEDTVEARTSLALDYLLNYEELRYIELAVEHLKTVTKLSASSCIRLVECGGVGILHELIVDMNRSVACAMVVSKALAVIVNIAKFDITRQSLNENNEWPSTLIKSLESSKVYNEEVFVKAAVVLIIMNKTFSPLMPPKLKTKLKTLGAAFERRHDLQVKKTNEKFLKSNGKASNVKKTKQNFPTADLFSPDWILSKDKPTEILSRLESIQWICRLYNV